MIHGTALRKEKDSGAINDYGITDKTYTIEVTSKSEMIMNLFTSKLKIKTQKQKAVRNRYRLKVHRPKRQPI